MLPLFRDEAVAHATARLDGKVLLPSRLSTWLIGGVLMGALAIAGWFAATASYARTETVRGWLAPESGVVQAMALHGGLVVDLLVEEGDQVLVDAPLARMQLRSQGQIGGQAAAISRTLEKQRSATLAAYEATLHGLAAERSRLTTRLAALRAELAAAEADVTSLGGGQALVMARAVTIAKGEIEDVASRLDAIPAAESVARAEKDVAIGALDERLARLDSATDYTVTSPIDGRVDALVVRVGQSLAAGSSVAVLAPGGGELVAELFVPSRAVGLVNTGQTVELEYEAFPSQRFGRQEATVDKVFSTVLSADEAGVPGFGVSEPVFSARGRLVAQTMHADGASVPLRAGMLLSADIVIDRRTLAERLFDPAYAVGRGQ